MSWDASSSRGRPPLASYVPAWVAARQAEGASGAEVRRGPGVVMVCDVSGFTALSGQLAGLGAEGAELLWRLVNAYFGEMLDRIQAWGGDVLRFAGDAPIVLWPAGPGGLGAAARTAAAAGLELQDRIGRYDTGQGVVLRMRVGLVAGELVSACLGGVDGRWEHLVAGDPLADLGDVLREADVGEVVLSDGAWRELDGAGVGPRLGAAWRLDGLRREAAPSPRPLSEPEVDRAAVRPFVSRGVVARLEAGHAGWLGELRTISTLFVGVDGLDYGAPRIGDRLDEVTRLVQRVTYELDGSVNQLLMDDKGTIAVLAWGLPGSVHEDDALRAVRCAELLAVGLRELGLGARLGISTGRAFCGEIGNARRRAYGLLGASINLAARLMSRSRGDALCDEAVVRAVGEREAFEPLEEVALKGFEDPVTVYRPARRAQRRHDGAGMVGRQVELELLAASLERLREGSGGLVLIEGEAGIGKSKLVGALLDEAAARGLRPLVAHADGIEQRTPWYAFRDVFDEVAGVSHVHDPAERRAAAQAWLAGRPGLAQVAPLFNPVLRLDQPDTPTTAAMEGEARAETTRAACASILEAVAPLLILVEDAHWLDSASSELLRRLARDRRDGLFVVTTRPPGTPAPDTYAWMADWPGCTHVHLRPLAHAEAEALVCRRLGVRALPPEVAALIRARAEGHPFFSEQIALALRDRGLLEVVDGEARLTERGLDLADAGIPSTLEGVIASRLDSLSPDQQLGVKTASVIGRVFSLRMLEAIHPIPEARPQLAEDLEAARALEITEIETPRPDLSYIFRHALTQDVAYGQLLYEQRRELHRAAAEWYASGRDGGASPPYPLLAWHWERADVRDKAIDALEAAGEEAIRSFANREALSFMEGARRLDDAGPPSPARRRARWERVIGEAWARQGHLTEARAHLVQAVALLGQPLPRTRLGVGLGLLWEAARQAWRRYRGAPRRDDVDRSTWLDAANAYAELGLMAYFQGEALVLLYGSLRALNLAEEVGPSPDLARLKAAWAIVVASVPLHAAAESYSKEALATADRFPDPYARANARHYRGAYLCGMGHWARAEQHFSAALEGYAAVGDGRRQAEAVNCLAQSSMNLGDLRRAAALVDQLDASGRHREDAQVRFWGRVARLELLWRTGRVDEAVPMCRAMRETEETDEQIYHHRAQGLRVHVYLAAGLLDDALAAARPLLPPQRAASFIELWAVTALADLYLTLWERRGPATRREAARACKALDGFAAVFPLGLPYAGIARGRLEALRGRAAAAAAAWARAVAHAQEFGMPWEELAARRLLVSVVPEAARVTHLQAIATLEQRLADAAPAAATA